MGAGDPAALALGLHSASRAKADAFLDDQRRMLHLQMEEMRAEEPYKLSHFRLRRFSGWAKAAFEFSAGLLALALVGGLGAMVWSAAHADGLIVESFKVPPELAEKGLTGDVVATRLLDELSAMQAQSTSIRAAGSFANNWGDDLKVAIPETGVSLGEVNRYLRGWLGHETHISGEVVRQDGGGLELTVRAGSEAAESVSGSAGDFHGLLQKAATAIYARTQPYRYVNILAAQGRVQEEEALALARTRTGPAAERAWAYSTVGATLASRGRVEEGIRARRTAIAVSPGFSYGWYDLARSTFNLEEALADYRKSLSLVGPGTADLLPDTLVQLKNSAGQGIAGLLGDYDEQVRAQLAVFPMIDLSADPVTQIRQAQSATGGGVATPITVHAALARARINRHDFGEARRFLAEEPIYIAALKGNSVAAGDVRGQARVDRAAFDFRNLELSLAMATGDWPRVRQLAPALEAEAGRLAGFYLSPITPARTLWPSLAYAEAQLGNFPAAHARIDRTPADCQPCLRRHAQIDALEKNYGGADFWFARAVAAAPSIPFAYEEWGRSLLDRGKPNDAITQFMLSNKKGPHYADPLEGWGEALMAKNQSHLAVKKFSEAEKYAPNWGRLQLKWGEALTYAGKPAEARAHFARAATLDLTPAEKAELARVNHG